MVVPEIEAPTFNVHVGFPRVGSSVGSHGVISMFAASATSLRSHLGRPVARADFARRLFGTLEPVLDLHADRGFAALRPRFDRFYRMAGRRITVSEPGGAGFPGTALELDADGALRVQRDDGSVVRVLAGDVTLAPRAQVPA